MHNEESLGSLIGQLILYAIAAVFLCCAVYYGAMWRAQAYERVTGKKIDPVDLILLDKQIRVIDGQQSGGK